MQFGKIVFTQQCVNSFPFSTLKCNKSDTHLIALLSVDTHALSWEINRAPKSMIGVRLSLIALSGCNKVVYAQGARTWEEIKARSSFQRYRRVH
jgi:hypothetical protein